MADDNPPPPLEVRALAPDRAGIQAEFQALTREQWEQRKVEMGKELLKFIKHKAWRTCKFINSDDQEANLCCKYLDSELAHAMDPDARQEWIATYGGEVAKALNTHRNNVNSALKEVMDEWQNEQAAEV